MLYKYVNREALKEVIVMTIFATFIFGLIANLIFINQMDMFKASNLRNVKIVQVEADKYFVVGDAKVFWIEERRIALNAKYTVSKANTRKVVECCLYPREKAEEIVHSILEAQRLQKLLREG